MASKKIFLPAHVKNCLPIQGKINWWFEECDITLFEAVGNCRRSTKFDIFEDRWDSPSDAARIIRKSSAFVVLKIDIFLFCVRNCEDSSQFKRIDWLLYWRLIFFYIFCPKLWRFLAIQANWLIVVLKTVACFREFYRMMRWRLVATSTNIMA